MSEQQGQGTSVTKVSLVISALPPLPVGILVKYLAGSKLLWVSCPEVSFPSLSTCFLSFKSLSTCLSCVCLPLGSALRAAVTEQLASEWGSPYSSESSACASCITLITPVPRMDNTIHKGGRDHPYVWSQMWFWSQSSLDSIHFGTVTSIVDQEEERKEIKKATIDNLWKTKQITAK